MTVLFLLLLIFGAVCFLLSAFSTRAYRADLLPLGLFFWILIPLIQTLQQV